MARGGCRPGLRSPGVRPTALVGVARAPRPGAEGEERGECRIEAPVWRIRSGRDEVKSPAPRAHAWGSRRTGTTSWYSSDIAGTPALRLGVRPNQPAGSRIKRPTD